MPIATKARSHKPVMGHLQTLGKPGTTSPIYSLQRTLTKSPLWELLFPMTLTHTFPSPSRRS